MIWSKPAHAQPRQSGNASKQVRRVISQATGVRKRGSRCSKDKLLIFDESGRESIRAKADAGAKLQGTFANVPV